MGGKWQVAPCLNQLDGRTAWRRSPAVRTAARLYPCTPRDTPAHPASLWCSVKARKRDSSLCQLSSCHVMSPELGGGGGTRRRGGFQWALKGDKEDVGVPYGQGKTFALQ